ncbi:A/G-specific adenine glycosylase [Maribacter sp. CXY002]|uniref:A/G-specific adenine glycosylase n=1 Tax=Maribacter luteocoastalis TaxID=3407671 RepID=UPI003B67330E
MSFSEKLLTWYSHNKRKLPWRNTKDPYKIWLSEIILQQTRVIQGMPYYERFIQAFPTVQDLASANEETVLKLWQGLGYYSRARNLHATAKIVVNDFDGVFPDTYKDLLKLKGIGDYTASAISSICFNEPHAVVDGNVYRVLARFYGIDLPINSTEGIKYYKELAQNLLYTGNVRDYNQAIMEFGAIQCTPKNPNCMYCPLNDKCVALKEGKEAVLPVKLKKSKVKDRYFNYLVPLYTDDSGKTTTLLNQRLGKGIWQNLWEFPLLESQHEIHLNDVEAQIQTLLPQVNTQDVSLYNTKTVIHKLSHQHLNTKFWIVESCSPLIKGISTFEIDKYPVPVLIADFMKTFKF